MMAVHNEHHKAHRLIQLKLDGLLSATDAAWLHAHLEACSGCHAYAAQLSQLDQALRLDSLAQREAITSAQTQWTAPLAPAHRRPGYALPPHPIRKRAKMNIQPLKSFANTLVWLALLAALAGGLAWVISTQLPQTARPDGVFLTSTPSPIPSPTAAPTATPTPVPLPEVNNREQIIAAVSTLAESDAAAYQQGTFWAYRITQDLNEAGSGVLNSTYIEEWIHIEDGKCLEKLTVSRDKPQSERLLSLQIGLPDGTSGDLIPMRQGEATGPGALQTDWHCSLLAANTDAGNLAARLKSGEEQLLIKGPNELKAVRAWYDTKEEHPVLVVEATFTGAGNVPEVQRETRRFEVASGRMLQEHIWMEWADGRPFGEFSNTKSTEFLPELPPEAAQLFAQSAAELLSYRNRPPVGTPTPLPTVSVAILDRLNQYTATNPLTDLPTIQHVMRALFQRHTAWLSQPGWVVNRPKSLEGKKWESSFSALLHVLPDGSCEQFKYFVNDGRILPQQMVLANGDWGLIGNVASGDFTEGKRAELPCQIENFETYQMLSGNVEMLMAPASGEVDIQTRAWVETRDGQPMLVIYQDITYIELKPITMDPDTGKLEQQERSENWMFFSLESGAYAGGPYQAYLTNGKVFGEPYQPDAPLAMETVFLKPLPADLAKAFQETLTALNVYLAQP